MGARKASNLLCNHVLFLSNIFLKIKAETIGHVITACTAHTKENMPCTIYSQLISRYFFLYQGLCWYDIV